MSVLGPRSRAIHSIAERNYPPLDGNFVSLGTFTFTADQPAIVTVSNHASDGYVVIDAVQFVPVNQK